MNISESTWKRLNGAEKEAAEYREALDQLVSTCLANDFNDCWDSYIDARNILSKYKGERQCPNLTGG